MSHHLSPRIAYLACSLITVGIALSAPSIATAQLAGAGKCGASENMAPTEVQGSLSTRQQFTQSVICLINAERTSRGLPGLRVNGRLVAEAASHAFAAVRLKWWTSGANPHVNPETGSTIETRLTQPKFCKGNIPSRVSEITYTASGDQATPIGAVNWWMNISTGGHREAILDPTIQYFGLAIKPDVADRNMPRNPKMGTYVFDFIACP